MRYLSLTHILLAISLPNIALHKSENLDPTTKSTRKPAKERKAVTEFMELLEKARDAVYNVHTRAIKCGSSTMTHSVASLLSEIIVLIHAVSSVKGKGPEHPFFASYSLGKFGLNYVKNNSLTSVRITQRTLDSKGEGSY